MEYGKKTENHGKCEIQLGHKNIQTTLNTYASVLDKFEAQEDEKLEEYLSENNIKIS